MIDIHRKKAAARMDMIGAGGGRWTWRMNALLMRAWLSQRHFNLAAKATGYSGRRCLVRVRRMMPPVMRCDARSALMEELAARASAKRRGAHPE